MNYWMVLFFFLALVIAIWSHSFVHYFVANWVVKLPSQLNLGLDFQKTEKRIHFGWFIPGSRFKIIQKTSSDRVHYPWKIILIYLSGILFSLALGYIAMVGAVLSSPGRIVSEKPSEPLLIERVNPGFPADIAGIRANDKILKINNQNAVSNQGFIEKIQQTEGPIELQIQRDQNVISLVIQNAKMTSGRKLIGIIFKEPEATYQKYNVTDAAQTSLRIISGQIQRVFKLSNTQAMGLAGPLFTNDSLINRLGKSYIFFMILAQISLALFFSNLIPLPPFDVGNAIFRGLGVSENKIKILNLFGIFFLLSFLFWMLH